MIIAHVYKKNNPFAFQIPLDTTLHLVLATYFSIWIGVHCFVWFIETI